METSWFHAYGLISKTKSLNSRCKSLLFLEHKLGYLGIYKLPAISTLSDGNCKRPNEVFGYIYYPLLTHCKAGISEGYLSLPINGEVSPNQVKVVDSTTWSYLPMYSKGREEILWQERKRRLQSICGLSFRPSGTKISLVNGSQHQSQIFLGRLKLQMVIIYVFGKGYFNYLVYKKWTEEGSFFFIRFNENANYEVISRHCEGIHDFLSGDAILDQLVTLKAQGEPLKLRLITYSLLELLKSTTTKNILRIQ